MESYAIEAVVDPDLMNVRVTSDQTMRKLPVSGIRARFSPYVWLQTVPVPYTARSPQNLNLISPMFYEQLYLVLALFCYLAAAGITVNRKSRVCGDMNHSRYFINA